MLAHEFSIGNSRVLIVLQHTARRLLVWLIFDVRQKMKCPFRFGLIAPAVLAEVSILARHSLGLTPCGIGDFILCATVLPLSLSQGSKFIVAFAVLKLLFAVSLYGLVFALLRRVEEGRATFASIAASIVVVGMSFGTVALK